MPSQQQADSVTRSLSLNDVLQQILSHLDKKTLVNFALIRRSSSEPALDLVWRDLPSFLPLLYLIPGFQMVNSQYVLTGNASEWDWSRYEFYAPRVRILNLATGTQQVPVAPGIYSCVARARPASIPLLPNLTTLNSGDISSSGYPQSLLLNVAGPLLAELNISANAQSDSFLTSLFTTLPTCAPQIESISLFDNQWRTQSHDVLSESSLQCFHNLHRLSLTAYGPHISLKFLRELGQRERFTSIALTLGAGIIVVEEDLSDLRFIGLKSLKLDADVVLLPRLTQCLGSQNLEDLTLYIRNPSGQGITHGCTASNLLHFIYRKWSHSLRSLCLYLCFSPGGNSLPLVIGSLVPLRENIPHNLTRFELRLHLGMFTTTPLSEDQLGEFICSLPKLEVLNLPPVNKVSFSMLQKIASHCPSLLRLQLGIDLTFISSTSPLPSSFNNRLHTLSVGDSWFPGTDNPERQRLVLWHLYHVFPSLLQVQHSNTSNSWRDVPKWFALFRATTYVNFKRPRI